MRPARPGKPEPPFVERRSGLDRRKQIPFPTFRSTLRRRRSAGRRKSDCGYVDQYDPRTWGLALSVLVLSIFDAVLTALQILQGRSREANPLMAAVIHYGGMWTFF